MLLYSWPISSNGFEHWFWVTQLFDLDVEFARVAELVDALVLGTSGVTRESSSLSFRTN